MANSPRTMLPVSRIVAATAKTGDQSSGGSKGETQNMIPAIAHADPKPMIRLTRSAERPLKNGRPVFFRTISADMSSPTGPGKAMLNTNAAHKTPVRTMALADFLWLLGKRALQRKATNGIDEEIRKRDKKK